MSTTYSYTLPTVKGTQVNYYAATSANSNPGVLTASSTGFSIVTPTNSTGVYVLAYDASDSSDKKLIFVNKESSTGGNAPSVGETKGALYLKSTTAGASWEAFSTGILVSNAVTSTVTGITAPSVGDFVIHYNGTDYSFSSYTAVNIHYPSGILVGDNSNTLDSITAPGTGNYIIHYDNGTSDYSLIENSSPTYQKGILVGDGSSTLKYMTGQEDDFSSTQSNYYIIKATTTATDTAPSTYSLSVVPLNGLLYTNNTGINSINIPAIDGNYVLNIDNNNVSMNSIPVPSDSGMIMYNAYTSAYKYIAPTSGYFYIKGTNNSNTDFFPFTLTNAYSGNNAGIIYVTNGAEYKQDVITFTGLSDVVSSACYTIKANYDNANAVTLESQIINSGIMYGTSNHDILYASFPSIFNPNDQYVIKYDSNDASLRLTSFTATASVSVPTSGILVGSANNVIGSIQPSSNVDDTFVINFSRGSTGIDDGTYSLTSLKTLLPTITTSFGSPFLFNIAGSQASATFVTLTNENYYCSTQVSIPTYALKTFGIKTRVDVEGIYRVNFDATTTTLKVDTNFSSSLAFPNHNMVDLTFILAFNDNYVYAGNFTYNSLAKIGSWTGVYATWDNSGYDFKVNTTKNETSFYITGDKNAGSERISLTSNISAIPITNSPPFEYRYFKTSLYFTANNFTDFNAVTSSTPKLYIFYGYSDNIAALANGISIANVNITVYSSTS